MSLLNRCQTSTSPMIHQSITEVSPKDHQSFTKGSPTSVSKKHCFQLVSGFSFSHFSYIFQPDGSSTQILGLLTSRSETKLKGWMLNAEEVRCQLLTHLKMQNKGPNRNLLISCLTLYTITRNSVIPVANNSSDLLHMCTGICNTIGHLCFQFPGTLGHSTGLY